ncbi:GNAT domain-containing protein [Multifurca ochricompacta]|uniref:GNAT domain-containing protein n=1 Tax=Multifurca ochricompacta TaxID=376703 RepID=A0AAD4ME49_9AGAM|nr:GNAT domain-containing protein [Multifurca ochricompacta]
MLSDAPAQSLQFGPFLINERTGEPYLRLPAPHENIIITAPRLQDAPHICEIMNDPRVYRWVSSPPFPYFMEHATSWLSQTKAEADAVWTELKQANVEYPNGPLKIVGKCPVRSILEENADGSYTFLGDCGIDRHRYEDVIDAEEHARVVQENNARPVGDLNIIWTIGDYLRPSHQGKGIMTAVIGTLMKAWWIPRMKIRCVRPSVFEGNGGSIRVFEKNGFVLWKTVRDCMHVMAKGEFPEELRTLHLLEWQARAS